MAEHKTNRVLRGGSWNNNDNNSKVDNRMKKYARFLKEGQIQLESILLSLNSWLGFIGKERYVGLINNILGRIKFKQLDKGYEFTFCV